ncbi:hypothetical protein IL306_001616 [Fusarium sp. DS 682]|nr:hypothetical protein IL306_001616 [Fusarium sp. DS 682]
MATLSEHPVFKELCTLVKLSPSDEDPNFPNFKKMPCFLWKRNKGNALQERFDAWKKSRIDNSGSASSEASLPSTSNQDRVFEFPAAGYFTPLPSPPVEDYAPRTAEKSSASSFDNFIPCTPSRINHHSPLPSIDDVSTSDDNLKYIPILVLGITPTPDKPAHSGKPDGITENVTEINVISPKEASNRLPILSKEDAVVEEIGIVETIDDDADVDENDSDTDEPQLAHPTLGQLGIRRNGTISNKSIIINELGKPLTQNQMRKGKVYVLKHKEQDNMFKIGWTATTASTSLSQPSNCYRGSCELKPIHESDEAFKGSLKAQRLAHVYLRDINLRVDKCEICGKGHREWFKGPLGAIMNTVRVMEDFVRRPAYDLEEKLLAEAKDTVMKMTNVTLKGIEGLREKDEESDRAPVQITGAKPLAVTKTAVSEDSADLHVRPGKVDESSSQTEVLATSSDAPQEPTLPSEAKRGIFRNLIKRHGGDTKNKIPKEEAEPYKHSANDEEFTVELLWTLDQYGGKNENKYDERPRA